MCCTIATLHANESMLWSKYRQKGNDMKRICDKEYSYKGFTVNGSDCDRAGLEWRIYDSNGDWIVTLPLKRDCKQWIDSWGE